jgi:hypothetical protein
MLYEKGRGVKRDYAQARSWFEKAAAQGDVIAQINLGMLYEKGWGVERDYARAKALYEQAAATAPIESVAKAYYTLGTIYEQGRLGIPRDITEARTMYYYAAGLRHTGAKAKLRQLR